jgi:hypothetical protein
VSIPKAASVALAFLLEIGMLAVVVSKANRCVY